jgi:orotidine-5'-phosphate decarboxylase
MKGSQLMEPRDRLVIALDVESLERAEEIVTQLGPEVLWYKVGLELFTAAGPEAVLALKRAGKRVFLDLKLHDIPTTVARAAVRGAQLGADVIDMHVAAGGEAMRAAVAAVREAAGEEQRPRLLGVTVLTSTKSLPDAAGARLAADTLVREVVARAQLAAEAGLDGVVCPVPAAEEVRRRCGEPFLLLTPGIRPAGSERGDQQWVATPRAALRFGARWMVVGRPITGSPDPREAARAILAEISAAAAAPGAV